MHFGIDIVDLQFTEAHHPRFSQRVFNPKEQSCLAKHRDDPSLPWAFWSMKEAAFKALSHQIGPNFHPKEWEVDWDAKVVQYQDYLLFAHVYGDADHVRAACASTASFQLAERFERQSAELPPALQSQRSRELLREICQEQRLLDRLQEQAGRPHLDHPQAKVSISHHGRYLYAGLAWDTGKPSSLLKEPL